MTVATTQLFKAYNAEAAGFTLVTLVRLLGWTPLSPKPTSARLVGSVHIGLPQRSWQSTQWCGCRPMFPVDDVEWKRCISVADCPDPKKSEWPTSKVYTLVASKFAESTSPK